METSEHTTSDLPPPTRPHLLSKCPQGPFLFKPPQGNSSTEIFSFQVTLDCTTLTRTRTKGKWSIKREEPGQVASPAGCTVQKNPKLRAPFLWRDKHLFSGTTGAGCCHSHVKLVWIAFAGFSCLQAQVQIVPALDSSWCITPRG